MSAVGRLRRLIRPGIRRVGPAEAARMADSGRAILLDVREPAEWTAGHAPRAQHVPLGELPARMTDLPADRPVITMCRSGARSARAAALLARNGHEVFNLAGGMQAWASEGLPVVRAGGHRGRVI
jgi:rhodanese-related sulfurtransferase